jgi:hypothetical protein
MSAQPVVPLPFPDPSIYQDMLWCANCGGNRIFLPAFEFEGGRVGCCLGCGEERVAWFTRATSEGG